MADLRPRIDDTRDLLNGSVLEARQMLRLLIVARLQMHPRAEGYEFSGVGTTEQILAGNVPKSFHSNGVPTGIRMAVTPACCCRSAVSSSHRIEVRRQG